MTISKRPADKTRKDAKETYELSVRMKRIFGKSRLELVLTVFEENHRECFVYETFFESLICYLRKKYQVCNSCRYLPIPEYFKILQSHREGERCKMIISRNPLESQYKVADFTAEFKVLNRSLRVLPQTTSLIFSGKLSNQPIISEFSALIDHI